MQNDFKKHLKNLKRVIDTAVIRGLFSDADTVGDVLYSFRSIEALVNQTMADNGLEKLPGSANASSPAPEQ